MTRRSEIEYPGLEQRPHGVISDQASSAVLLCHPSWHPRGFQIAVPPQIVAYGIQAGMRQEGEEQMARDTEPIPFYWENNSSPRGPAQETSYYIHGPKPGHVVSPAMRGSGKVNTCNWARGHPEKKKRTGVLSIREKWRMNNELGHSRVCHILPHILRVVILVCQTHAKFIEMRL